MSEILEQTKKRLTKRIWESENLKELLKMEATFERPKKAEETDVLDKFIEEKFPHKTLEQIKKEQNYKKPTAQEWRNSFKGFNLTEPLEKLLKDI